MRPRAGPITDVFVGVTPFLAVYMLAVFILLAFPGLATWLPQVMG
jgi:TRAP-type mannitol/chloroaromatic compound transport system permease large subunit